MTHTGKGLLAGLAATVVLSVLMIMKGMMGVMPALDIAKMLAGMMPMAGAGLFAMSMGAMAPVMTLMLHLIFGAVLGWTFGKMRAGASA